MQEASKENDRPNILFYLENEFSDTSILAITLVLSSSFETVFFSVLTQFYSVQL
jgi:hypothetical protein